jgi:Mg/Co/Ni transporter MgtE
VAELAIENAALRREVARLGQAAEQTEGLCELVDDSAGGGGWSSGLRSRASWLLGLLVAQSCSSFVLADNEALLQSHPTIVFFMTMLVGAGGNAGNQAAVRIIRGLATGDLNPADGQQRRRVLLSEVRVALSLGLILVVAGFTRVAAFGTATPADAAAIAASLFIIVTTSVVLGALLPLGLQRVRLDAANASTMIQVLMDVLGVLITCSVAPLVFHALGAADFNPGV